MENSSRHNESLGKYSKRVIFNSRTFNSKLFLKLVGPYLDPSIICIQTLRYEPENRKLIEIEKALPWLKTIPNLNKFINLKETPENSYKLLIELTWVLFYRYYKKNIILKKAAEKEEFFYILLGGKIVKLNIVYERESLTLEEYLIYLFKMKLIHEKEILNKCRLLNSFYADINGDNLYKFCKDNPQFNYEKLKEIAKNEITNLGFRIEDFQEKNIHKLKINSIQNYIKIASIKKRNKFFIDENKASMRFYLGKYVIAGYVNKGEVIGNLTEELYNDNSTYICIDNCDIALINKKKSVLNNLYKSIIEKKKRIFTEFKNEFFILSPITDKVFYNEIVPHFEYKQFHQGDKIFLQGSLYEGIYLLKEGKVNIYLNSSINDISNYISNIKNSLSGFKEYISILNIDKDIRFNEEELIKPKICNDNTSLTKENNDILNEINKYDVLPVYEYTIFGTNELFDYKTGIYYFSAECVTKEALIYFLPKKYFYSLLIKEKPFYLSLAETVESKVQYITGKLKYHIRLFEQYMIKKNKKLENNKLNINTLNAKDITNNNNKKCMSSIKILRRNNLTINDYIKLNKKSDESLEFPPLIKEKKEEKKQKNLFLQTISSFGFKNKYHKSIKEKEMCNKYKKINLRLLYHPKIVKILNKKGKSLDDKLFISKQSNKIEKNDKLNLPRNFPFNVQNSYCNTTFIPKKKYYSLRKSLIYNKC